MNDTKWINWLKDHPIINLLILLVYYLLVVLPHEQVGIFVANFFKQFSRDSYNLIITLISSSLLIICSLYFLRKILTHPDKKIVLFYLFCTIVFAVLCFKILFVVNIEFVHFVQYALFAILCFPLVLNYTNTLIWTVLAGAFDEAYQYFYLAPERTDYYDFNDVIINIVGAAFGLIIIKILNPVFKKFTWLAFLKSPLPYSLLLLAIAIFTAFQTNILALYPSDTATKFLLVKKIPENFWSKVYPEIIYHIVLPLEGLIIIMLLIFFYYGLEKSNNTFMKTN